MGAGRSASSLIRYLLERAGKDKWEITVGDFSFELAQEKTKGDQSARPISFDINNEKQRRDEIGRADLVISLLPPALHIVAAKECLLQKKNMVTASYITDEIRSLDKEAKKSGVLIMNECGLDPGIDHMSAMQIIHRLQAEGADITSFKSYTGGLIAPESNDNPWSYKFTWNPRNVVLAGQGTARYIENNRYKYIPYSSLFDQSETIDAGTWGLFEGYANRDSLAYRHHYQIENIPTLLRGTLRNDGFCKAWNVFVKLGITDDSFVMEGSSGMTYEDFIRSFLPAALDPLPLPVALARFTGVDEKGAVIDKISWTGILDPEPIGLPDSSPAKILQHKLEQKWALKQGDKDLIIMIHRFNYRLKKKVYNLQSLLVVKGEDSVYTAMARTVGLPLGITAGLMLHGTLKLTGVHLPVMKEIYDPVLRELESFGISFREEIL